MLRIICQVSHCSVSVVTSKERESCFSSVAGFITTLLEFRTFSEMYIPCSFIVLVYENHSHLQVYYAYNSMIAFQPENQEAVIVNVAPVQVIEQLYATVLHHKVK